MMRLHPHPDPFHACPYCHILLEVKGWYIPGMRMLADLYCQFCGRTFFGDLLAGHGLFFPMLVDRDSGQTHDPYQVGWFADWLKGSYANRQNKPLDLTVETLQPLRRPVLLNCLDVLYGHSLLKLLNAQYYIDHAREYDLVLLIPRFLRWMVPEGVAAIWTVDLPLREGTQWNDWLAAELHKLLGHFDEVWLSVAFSHPHPDDFDIAQFTRIVPFPIEKWETRLDRPTVTFIWREDRSWYSNSQRSHSLSLQTRIRGLLNQRQLNMLRQSSETLTAFAEKLRQQIPKLNFAVAGIGIPGGLSPWVIDLRSQQINADIEQMWCDQYARSHVVVGVHGSNMLLPSAHAGAVVELVPPNRWGNILQDFLFRSCDTRLAALLYRTLPLSTSVNDLVNLVVSLLSVVGSHKLEMSRDYTDHQSPLIFEAHKKWKLLRAARLQHLMGPASTTISTSKI